MFENVPYAMTQAAYADLRAAVERVAAGGPVAALSFGSRLPPKASANHVAIVPVTGVLMKNPTDWQRKLGATSTVDIHEQFEHAMADPDTHAILLHTDSPGGTVDGAHALAEHILNSRNRGKQIHAFADGMAGSAAYWVASSAHKVWAATPSTHVGSIGVIAGHVDRSAALGAAGLKVTELVSGKYKGAGSPNASLSDDHRNYMQAQVDELHRQFAGHVVRARGLPASELPHVTDGRIFLGHEAVKRGLADGVKTFGEVLAGLTSHAATTRAPKPPAVQHDVAARARVWAIAEEKRTGRRVTALESINHILGLGV